MVVIYALYCSRVQCSNKILEQQSMALGSCWDHLPVISNEMVVILDIVGNIKHR